MAEIKNQTGVNVMGNADGIQISNVGDAMVDIYSLAGVQLATGVRDGFVNLPKATYIVKVSGLAKLMMTTSYLSEQIAASSFSETSGALISGLRS